MASVQDQGRFGFRQYGIPQSGAMDLSLMKEANHLAGNPEEYPVIEFAMAGMKLEVIERSIIGVSGAEMKIDNQTFKNTSRQLNKGQKIELMPPKNVYAYLSIAGLLKSKKDFGSYSTYSMAGFGGIEGRSLHQGDILETTGDSLFQDRSTIDQIEKKEELIIRIVKGPEWSMLKESPENKNFIIDSSSNRMGIRVTGDALSCDGSEIVSSAVIPGTIQLPSSGQPIILMNDCGTTGGYPRIGKVVNEDLGKLAQLRFGRQMSFVVTN